MFKVVDGQSVTNWARRPLQLQYSLRTLFSLVSGELFKRKSWSYNYDYGSNTLFPRLFQLIRKWKQIIISLPHRIVIFDVKFQILENLIRHTLARKNFTFCWTQRNKTGNEMPIQLTDIPIRSSRDWKKHP